MIILLKHPTHGYFRIIQGGALEGDIYCALGGNSPVFVDKKDGAVLSNATNQERDKGGSSIGRLKFTDTPLFYLIYCRT